MADVSRNFLNRDFFKSLANKNLTKSVNEDYVLCKNIYLSACKKRIRKYTLTLEKFEKCYIIFNTIGISFATIHCFFFIRKEYFKAQINIYILHMTFSHNHSKCDAYSLKPSFIQYCLFFIAYQ